MKRTKKIKGDTLIFPRITPFQIEQMINGSVNGNLQDKLTLIMHNQGVLNKKLNKLVKAVNLLSEAKK